VPDDESFWYGNIPAHDPIPNYKTYCSCHENDLGDDGVPLCQTTNAPGFCIDSDDNNGDYEHCVPPGTFSSTTDNVEDVIPPFQYDADFSPPVCSK
jgi:hypothetical protein